MTVIGLLTDFGLKGQHYVASMKGVILNINPAANIIDIAHTITPFSVLEASYLMRSVYKQFPKGSVFVMVIDPGVGSSRSILLIKTKNDYFFIGPNNGMFLNIFCKEEIERCIKLQNEKYFLQPLSNTFHGRDIMAPIAAHITLEIPLEEFGIDYDREKILTSPTVYKVDHEGKQIECIIQYIDSFGNIITNIPVEDNSIKRTDFNLKIGSKMKVFGKLKMYSGTFVSHFSNVKSGDILFLLGSTGFLEISKNQGHAANDMNFKVGDTITVIL